ncbi:MAG: nucleotidyltransferase [Spirochaetes bacterium GWF1_51_8]|nr:MAG: nucleotidyltransferase [Spirochaetes bacterium GWF1_51_8]
MSGRRREFSFLIDDILKSAEKIVKLVEYSSFERFQDDWKGYDAVLRNLEIIGEAVKNLPQEYKDVHPEIEWRKIAGLRDVIIHRYFGIDDFIIWDIVTNKIPVLIQVLSK